MNPVLPKSRKHDSWMDRLNRRSTMKGFIAFILFFVMVSNTFASSVLPINLMAIKLSSGEVISKLTLKESTIILKSLDNDSNIEIRHMVIYPEEVSQLITSKLTNNARSGKNPNPGDYN